jgi:hypothetical protein
MIRLIKNIHQILVFLFLVLCFFVVTISAFAQINKNDENLGKDLESLGLDSVENQPLNVVKNQQISSKKNKKKPEKKNLSPKNLTPNFSNNKNLKLVGTKNGNPINAKIEQPATKSPENLTTEDSEIKLDKADLKNLEELRKIYVSKLQNNNAEYEDEDLDFNENILPHKKNLQIFATEELPPIPILNRNRSLDNMHIPYVTTPKENIEAMFLAIKLKDVNFFNEIFKYVQNPNISNNAGDTVLTASMLSRFYPMVASALAKGADPNMPNKLGYNPLTIAIELNDFQMVEILVKNKADLFFKDSFNRTYLMQAARVGSLSVVDLLIRYGIDINSVDNEGLTALAIAQKYKQNLVVQYLIKNNAKTS